MTKNRFIAIATFLAIHSAVLAWNVLRTGQLSPYAQHDISSLLIQLFSFVGLSLLVLTVKQRIWRVGGILAALAVLSRSCIAYFPDQKYTVAIITLAVGSASIAALVVSWRVETFDMSWWEQRRNKRGVNPAFIYLVLLAMAGVFLYWGSS